MSVQKPFLNSIAAKLALTAVVTCVASPAAMAAIQCRNTPINLTATTDLYINLVTGVANASSAAVTGWDVNPYPSTSGLAVYWGGTGTTRGGLASTTTGPFTVLASGAPITPTSTYAPTATGVGGMESFYVPTGGTNRYLGVKFPNESIAGSPINYGWISITTTAAASAVAGAGYPAVINGWCWQDDGTQITAGTTPVALQKFSVD